MLYVKFALMAFGAIGTVLTLTSGAMSAGVHGIIILVGCALPVGLGMWTISSKIGMPRWASIVSLVGLLVVGMKTSEALENIMMAAFAGMICALVLAIKPDRGAGARPIAIKPSH